MDILSKFTIPAKGLSIGNHNFEFQIDRNFFENFEGSPVLGGEAKVRVQAQKTASGLVLDFLIEGEAEVQCDRCLELLSLPIEYEGTLTVRVGDGDQQGEYDGEVIWIGSADAQVEVAQYIYESICLSLPMLKVHGVDKNGVSLCDPDMLARFMIVSQAEFDEIEKKNERNPLKEELEKIKEK